MHLEMVHLLTSLGLHYGNYILSLHHDSTQLKKLNMQRHDTDMSAVSHQHNKQMENRNDAWHKD